MLIDDLINTRYIENLNPRSLHTIQQTLKNSQKFELAADFSVAAEQLASDYQVIAHAVPHCRLPFANTWIEVAQQHRPRFLSASIHIPAIQRMPHRVGFLLTTEDPNLATFKAHQFWTLRDFPNDPQASHIAMEFDPTKMLGAEPITDVNRYDAQRMFQLGKAPEWVKAPATVRGQLAAIVGPTYTDYFTGIEPLAERDSTIAQLMLEIGAADWSGENIFLLAVLALLNTLNATQSVPSDLSKLNHSRIKQKKPPLAEHHILTIHPRIKRFITTKGSAGHRELAMTFVRGHFKVRKTGIFFWRPHTRGDKDLGTTTKTYKID